jgi:hypothetical protein
MSVIADSFIYVECPQGVWQKAEPAACEKEHMSDKVSIVPEVLEEKFSIVLLLPSKLLFFVSTNS